MGYIIVFVIIIIVVLAIADEVNDRKKQISKEGKENKSPYRYRRKDFLMSRAEHEFFDVLDGIRN